ncbi:MULTISPECIES: hypothetical protein [Burkholderia]|jgi:hypothetical protein|nr:MULTISPECIES: hypothetical protein [Burkholderia]
MVKPAASNLLAPDRAVDYSDAHEPTVYPFDYLRRTFAGGVAID